MLIPNTNYRAMLEGARPSEGFWLDCGLGHPVFDGNPAGVAALESVPRLRGSNRYACEVPGTLFEAIKAFILLMFKVVLSENQIAVTTIGTRCVPGYISLQFLAENHRPMRWLAGAPGYPGHTVVINQYGGVCDREATNGFEFIDVVEAMETEGRLQQYDAVIFQAVVNPTARRTSDGAVRRAAELADRSGKLVYFDGAYQCVTHGSPVPSPLFGVDSPYSNIIWTYSTSKGDQLASLAYSLLIGDPRWVSRFNEVQSATREGASMAGYSALEACLGNPGFLIETAHGYDRLHRFLTSTLSPAGLSVPKREGSIFAYVPISQGWLDAGKNSFDYAMALAQRGVLTYTDLQFFDTGKHLRVNLSSSLDVLQVRSRLTELVASINHNS
jgi:aspartate/methionine/tyrosine aminotransferase